MPNSVQVLKTAIARISHDNGAVVGAGFLVSDRHLFTCAHVVTAALGLPKHTQEMPEEAVKLDFPLRMDGTRYEAKVVIWHPIEPGKATEDIAVLELSEPQTTESIRMISIPEVWGHPLRTFGFPKGHDEGVWATGTLRDQRGNGWIQLDSLAVQDRAIEPGFSGAPIWDEQAGAVVGMAVAAEKQRQGVSAAYLIPALVLQGMCSEPGVERRGDVTPDKILGKPQKLSRGKQLELEYLQEKCSNLEQSLQRVKQEINVTVDPMVEEALENRLKLLARKIDQVESKIQTLERGNGQSDSA